MKQIADILASMLRTFWRILIVIVFLVSISLNISTFALGLTSSVVASMVEAVTGLPQLGSIRSKNLELSGLQGKVEGLNLRAQKAEGQVAKLTSTLAAQQKVVATVGRKVTKRTAAGATRNVAATFGESIPVIGVGVVVAATAWELKDACDTMKDLHELEVALDPAKANDASVQEVCGLRVPSKEEIWEKVKSSPGAAWQMAQDAMPELPEMPEFTMPELPSIDWKFWD